ncbi:MAG: histidinol dehydrogenase, partial [Myxococcaceae bacterium]
MSASVLKYQGALSALTSEARRRLLERAGSDADAQVAARVQALIARVRAEGDRALFDFARQFDRVELKALEVPRARWDAALESLPTNVREALARAARNIARAHAAQRPMATEVETEPGVVVGRRPDPLGRVGVY